MFENRAPHENVDDFIILWIWLHTSPECEAVEVSCERATSVWKKCFESSPAWIVGQMWRVCSAENVILLGLEERDVHDM